MSVDFIVEYLPSLFNSALNVIDRLAPPNVTKAATERALKDLKIPGSTLAGRMKFDEARFTESMKHYGSSNFIQVDLVLQKITVPISDTCRPDALLYTGNLAMLLKNVFVMQEEAYGTYTELQSLDRIFPGAFVSQFDENISLGKSNLLELTFDLALELRTQTAIAVLLHTHQEEHETFIPEKILANIFYEIQSDSPEYKIFFQEGRLLDIMKPVTTNSNAQKTKLRKRVLEIRQAFRFEDDATLDGDLVDFTKLRKDFPWLKFVIKTVKWSQSRLEELISSVEKQGNSEEIKEALEVILDNYSQDLSLVQPVSKAKTSFSADRSSTALTKIQRISEPHIQPKNVPDLVASSTARRPPTHTLHGTSKSSINSIGQDLAFSASRAADLMVKDRRIGNKENRPLGSIMTTAQARPTAVQADDENGLAFQDDANSAANDPDPSNYNQPDYKKSIKHSDPIEEETSEDEGFQMDQEQHIPKERARLTPSAQATAEQSASSSDTELSETEDDDIGINPSQATQISRMRMQRARFQRNEPTRARIPWSESDQRRLIHYIGKYGCSWATIEQNGRFERTQGVNQVGLKDKARNLKVNYLKAGTAFDDLPLHFDRIALGIKEKRAVNAARPGFFPEVE
ncbi:hypothetical protein B0O99DRAFT_607132 [Bisporella sp. PMI_857]|nr:hypothetical protein B0O99DRAFT_607132 [Bisporella sp. PMI_857]